MSVNFAILRTCRIGLNKKQLVCIINFDPEEKRFREFGVERAYKNNLTADFNKINDVDMQVDDLVSL